MIDVDPVSLDAQAEQSIALSGQVLLIGGASGLPDKQRARGALQKLGSSRLQLAARPQRDPGPVRDDIPPRYIEEMCGGG